VRGQIILFDQDTINAYLGNPLTLPPPEDPIIPTLCEYGQKEEDKEWDHEQIQRDILFPGKSYNRGKSNEYTTANVSDMTLEAAMLFQFIVHNVWPKSHVTTTPVAVTPLIWHILKGREVDVARIISNQLRYIALSGLLHKATKLGFPGFIMGLVRHQGVQIPEPFSEKITGAINDRYIHNHAQKLAGIIPHDPEPAHEHEPELEPEQEHDQEIPHDIPQQQDIPQHPASFDFASFSAYLTQHE
jgi:hypothetical protein